MLHPPPNPAALLGRDALIARLDALLTDHGARLVTLTGAPGVGKSRLAAHVSESFAAREGIAYRRCALARVRGDDAVGVALTGALGPTTVDDSPAIVLLDDADHVLAPLAERCAALLASAPQLRLIVTSRTRLGLRAEVVVDVPPLAEADARWLFVTRSYAVGGALPGEGDDDDLAAIVAAADRTPLAVEALAARARSFPLAIVREEARARLGGLCVGLRDAPPHHQSLDAAVTWSLELLPREERDTLRDLAEIPGAFDLDAARAVAGVDGRPVEDAVHRLRERSLLRGLPNARFKVPRAVSAAIRDDDALGARRRVVSHYLGLAARWSATNTPAAAAMADHDNVLAAQRATCDPCAERSRCERAARLGPPLWWGAWGVDCDAVDPGGGCAVAPSDRSPCDGRCHALRAAAALLETLAMPCGVASGSARTGGPLGPAVTPCHPRPGGAADGDPPTLVIARDGSCFRLRGEVVDLSAHRTLAEVLLALMTARVERPGEVVPTAALHAQVWGGGDASRSGTARLYVAVSKLRGMGLEGYILRGRGGYRLNPEVSAAWCSGQPPRRE